MSKYTITLRNIEKYIGKEKLLKFFTDYNLEDYLTEKQINIINERGLWTKEKLAQKIVDHYFFSEIRF